MNPLEVQATVDNCCGCAVGEGMLNMRITNGRKREKSEKSRE